MKYLQPKFTFFFYDYNLFLIEFIQFLDSMFGSNVFGGLFIDHFYFIFNPREKNLESSQVPSFDFK